LARSGGLPGMAGRADNVAHAADLHDAPRIHDGNAVRHLDRHRDVVRDEDHGQTELALQLAQQQQDLHLDGGIERGGRLVGEQDARTTRQRERDHGALSHAARHLVGVGGEPALRARDADALEKVERPLARLGGGNPLVPEDRLDDLPAHGIHRVQRQHGLLEHHGHRAAPEVAERAALQRHHVRAVDADAAFHA
jgi:hypothetical protein